jgi:hypothetical protein
MHQDITVDLHSLKTRFLLNPSDKCTKMNILALVQREIQYREKQVAKNINFESNETRIVTLKQFYHMLDEFSVLKFKQQIRHRDNKEHVGLETY